jgi:hypothetical protein
MLNLAVRVDCETKLRGPDVVGHVHIQEGIEVHLVIIGQPSMNAGYALSCGGTCQSENYIDETLCQWKFREGSIRLNSCWETLRMLIMQHIYKA